jgi:hypothetical protein
METAKGKNRPESQRSVIQTVLPILILVGLVAGTTFIYTMTNRDTATTEVTPTNVARVKLSFPETSFDTPKDYLLHSTGHLDFWFANPQPTPVEIGLTYTNCDCTGVQLGLLSPEGMTDAAEWPQFQSWVAGTQTSVVGLMAGGLPQALARAAEAELDTHQRLGEKLRWQELVMLKPPRPAQTGTVPAGAAGVLRLHFEAKKEFRQTDHMKADLWTRTAGTQETITQGPQLVVSLRFVRPIQFEPENIVYGVGPVEGDQPSRPTAKFVCYSTTLSQFRLKAKPDSPCLEVTCQPLSPEQRAYLEETLRGRKLDAPVTSGYVLEVTAHGRRGGAELDLGPFSRHIQLTSEDLLGGADNFPEVGITGVVHGDVTVTAPAPEAGQQTNDFIVLGTFRADRGKSITATVQAQSSGVELDTSYVRLEPADLEGTVEARLVPQKTNSSDRPAWDLQVKIPANRLHGPLPKHTAILLKLKGNSPRALRVPIAGVGVTEFRAHR